MRSSEYRCGDEEEEGRGDKIGRKVRREKGEEWRKRKGEMRKESSREKSSGGEERR